MQIVVHRLSDVEPKPRPVPVEDPPYCRVCGGTTYCLRRKPLGAKLQRRVDCTVGRTFAR
jgi:hypothetical protein